jgi:hypothetical protein
MDYGRRLARIEEYLEDKISTHNERMHWDGVGRWVEAHAVLIKMDRRKER